MADYTWPLIFHLHRRTAAGRGVREVNLTLAMAMFEEVFDARNLKMAGIQALWPMSGEYCMYVCMYVLMYVFTIYVCMVLYVFTNVCMY